MILKISVKSIGIAYSDQHPLLLPSEIDRGMIS